MADTLAIVPSYSTAAVMDQAADVVVFGDAYEQRAPRGLNSKRLAFRLVYSKVTKAKAAAVLAFFYTQGLTKAFLWTPPPPYNAAPFSDGAPMQWIARQLPDHSINAFDSETVTVQIEQDFNPLS